MRIEQRQRVGVASAREQDLGAQQPRFEEELARRKAALVEVERLQRRRGVVVAVPALERRCERSALGVDRARSHGGSRHGRRCGRRFALGCRSRPPGGGCRWADAGGAGAKARSGVAGGAGANAGAVGSLRRGGCSNPCGLRGFARACGRVVCTSTSATRASCARWPPRCRRQARSSARALPVWARPARR